MNHSRPLIKKLIKLLVSLRLGGGACFEQLSNYQILKNQLVPRYYSLEVSRHCDARLSRHSLCIVPGMQLITAFESIAHQPVDSLCAYVGSDTVPEIYQLCSLFPIQPYRAEFNYITSRKYGIVRLPSYAYAIGLYLSDGRVWTPVLATSSVSLSQFALY